MFNENKIYLDDILKETDINSLKEHAKELDIQFSNNIGIEALKDKFKEYYENLDKEQKEKDKDKPKVEINLRQYLRDKHLRLIRVKVHCNNKANKEGLFGEIFATGNTYLGTVKKYIPYDSEEFYHIPYCLYKMLSEKVYPTYPTPKKKNGVVGMIKPKTVWVKEYNIEVGDPLSKEELDALAQAQKARSSVENEDY